MDSLAKCLAKFFWHLGRLSWKAKEPRKVGCAVRRNLQGTEAGYTERRARGRGTSSGTQRVYNIWKKGQQVRKLTRMWWGREKTRRMGAHLATAVKDNKTNVSINTLTIKWGLRRISFTGWLGNLETNNEEKSQVPWKVVEQTILSAIMWHMHNNQGSGPVNMGLWKTSPPWPTWLLWQDDLLGG